MAGNHLTTELVLADWWRDMMVVDTSASCPRGDVAASTTPDGQHSDKARFPG